MSEQRSPCRTAAFVALAFAAGMLFGKWRMIRAPIDEYHAVRMELEDRLHRLSGDDDE